MEDMGNDPQSRERDLRSSADRRSGQHSVGRGRRPVRRAPQPLCIFSRHHRQSQLQPPCAQLIRPRLGSEVGRHHAQLSCSSCPICATTPTMARAAVAASTVPPADWSPPTSSSVTLVPKILASPAYRRDGLLIITFDESDLVESLDHGTGVRSLSGDGAACCNEQPGPNIAPYNPAAVGTWESMNGPGIIGPGGGRVGAVMLSPYIRPGTVSTGALQPLRFAQERRGFVPPAAPGLSPPSPV